MSEAQSISDGSGKVRDLTAFQQNILAILAEEARYGLAIKRELENYYGTEVNHGRLYPNLDDLVEDASSKRANSTSERTSTSSPMPATTRSSTSSSGRSRSSSPTTSAPMTSAH